MFTPVQVYWRNPATHAHIKDDKYYRIDCFFEWVPETEDVIVTAALAEFLSRYLREANPEEAALCMNYEDRVREGEVLGEGDNDLMPTDDEGESEDEDYEDEEESDGDSEGEVGTDAGSDIVVIDLTGDTDDEETETETEEGDIFDL